MSTCYNQYINVWLQAQKLSPSVTISSLSQSINDYDIKQNNESFCLTQKQFKILINQQRKSTHKPKTVLISDGQYDDYKVLLYK